MSLIGQIKYSQARLTNGQKIILQGGLAKKEIGYMVGREKFQRALNELENKLIELGTFADRALKNSIEALEMKDTGRAIAILEKDREANRLHEEINDFAIMLIATQAPVAIDLRRIITGIKMADNIERIADFAVNIARSTIRIGQEEHIGILMQVKKMYEITSEMLKMALSAYHDEDTQKAKKILEMDDKVDALYDQTVWDLFEFRQQTPQGTMQIIQLLLVCRYLERAADHVTNIAEHIIFLVKGKRYSLNN